MATIEKILFKILSGASDSNILFEDIRKILEYCGFECRIKGSHHIYFKKGIDEIINI